MKKLFAPPRGARSNVRRAALLGTALAAGLTLAAGGAQAQTYEFLYEFGSPGSGLGQFDSPRGVAVDAAGRTVVADASNDRVQVCDVSDSAAVVCDAFGSMGSGLGEFDFPSGVVVDAAGRIVVADTANDRVQICDVSDLGNVSCQVFDGLGGGSGLGRFDFPPGVAVDAVGHIVVADRGKDHIQICDVSDLGNGNLSCRGFGGSGGGIGQFDSPTSVAVDAEGSIVVADTPNDRIQICDVSDLANGNVLCQAFGGAGTGPGQFNTPRGVAVDPTTGNIVVADEDNNRIQVCDVSDLDNGNVACEVVGEGGSGPGQFDGPVGVAVDAAGNIMVADTGNSRIQLWGLDTDADDDGIDDDADNCVTVTNSAQIDTDRDGKGDACDADDDGDGVNDDVDNCPLDLNAGQVDSDGDGAGDACDADADGDADGDGVQDVADACLPTAEGEVVDATGCAIADLCPCDNAWKNHGAYVSCTSKAAGKFAQQGLITKAAKGAITSAAAKSQCGKKGKK